MELPIVIEPLPDGGWLADDDLTQDWIQQVKEYRAACDAADRERLGLGTLRE